MNDKEILEKVDHTNLDSTATWGEIEKDAKYAAENGCATLCVAPYYIKKLHAEFKNTLKLCTVIGFPRGDSTTKTKVFETIDAIENGASEIDVVANISEIKNGNFDFVKNDLIEVRKVCSVPLKVIIETYFLTPEEIEKMTHIVAESGADYIKTCTGNINGGATEEAVEIIVENLTKGLKIKVSGGVTTRQAAEMFINMGADRIGTKFTANFVGKL